MKKVNLVFMSAILAVSICVAGCKVYVNSNDPGSSSGSVIVGHSGKSIDASEKTVTKTLNVNEVSKLDLGGAIQVVYVQNNSTSVEFVVPENVADFYEYEVTDGKLEMWKKDNITINFKKGASPKLLIKSPEINYIEMGGACSFTTSSLSLPSGNLKLDLSGASSFLADKVACAKFEGELSGASSVKIASLTASKMEVDCSGASNMKVVAEVKMADIECSGASNVDIEGTADNVTLECSGASNIDARNFKAKSGKADASGLSSVRSNIADPSSLNGSGMSSVKNKRK